jgi:xanthine dehydrogenase iron-sulfur cluster and FAD-binding subunit A
MRASAAYRTRVAQNLVLRLWNGLSGQKTTVLEVAP